MGQSLENPWLAISFFIVALVYAAVGQAGASGYIAIMGVLGVPAAAMKTSALALNLVVAAIATLQFWRLRKLSWKAAYPFAILGFPFSLLGGAVHLPTHIYYPAIGVVLVLSATVMMRSAISRPSPANDHGVAPPFMPALLTGAAIGFVSGTTGTGGGVFLAPIIIAMGWASPRQTATTTAVYNLVNSAAALIGAHRIWAAMPSEISAWIVAVAIGGMIGAFLGSRYLPDRWLRAILAVLLLISGAKLLVS